MKCGLTWLSPEFVSAARYWTLRVVGPMGVCVAVRVGVNVGTVGVLVRVDVFVATTGVLVRVGVFVAPAGVLVRVGVFVDPVGVLVRVGVAEGTGVPPGSLPQTREPFIYAGIFDQSA